MSSLRLFCLLILGVSLVSSEKTNTTLALARHSGPHGPILYVLDDAGVFHRAEPLSSPPKNTSVSYTVIKSGVLVPKVSEYSVLYTINKHGDLIPDPSNKCIYKSNQPATFLKAFRDVLIPVHLPKERVQVAGPEGKALVPFSPSPPQVYPDLSCSGDVVLFALNNSGILERSPADPYLPQGMKMTYSVSKEFVLQPKYGKARTGMTLTYSSAENGNLVPAPGSPTLRTKVGETVPFMLGDAGKIFPVQQVLQNSSVMYFFNGQLIHISSQLEQVKSNSSTIIFNEEQFELCKDNNDVATIGQDPHFVCSNKHIIHKRDLVPRRHQNNLLASSWRRPAIFPADIPSPPLQVACAAPVIPRSQPYCIPEASQVPQPYLENVAPNRAVECSKKIVVFDERGRKVPIIPEITCNSDVILYKLTCRGTLVRFPSCREPDSGFDINFQLLPDTFTLVPSSDSKGLSLSFTLQDNGDLRPSPLNKNTFTKAPGSLIIYMLGKNNVLFVVEQRVNPDGSVTYLFEGQVIVTTCCNLNQPLKFHTTINDPIFAIVNGKFMFTCHSTRVVHAKKGSTWINPNKSTEDEKVCRDLYLLGSSGERIAVVPYLTKKGVPVVYDLDWNGVFHKSPKDDRKWISLKSYTLLEHMIMLPTKSCKDYVYIVAKNGDLMPYLYPDKVLKTQKGCTKKYVRCEKGILIPIRIEIINNFICYSFNDVILYKKRSFCSKGSNYYGNRWKKSNYSPESSSDESSDYRRFKTTYRGRSSESLESRERKKNIDRKWRKKTERRRSSESLESKERQRKIKEEFKPEFKLYDIPFKLFVDKNGSYVYFEKCDKLLVRYPPIKVPDYLKHTMGSFKFDEDSLKPIPYRNPDKKTINMMIEDKGDFLLGTRNLKEPSSPYYLLLEDGTLFGVDGNKKPSSITFSKKGKKLLKARFAVSELKTPLGKDPMHLKDDPEPKSQNSKSLFIPIPMKNLEIPTDGESSEPCRNVLNSMKELLNEEGASKLAVELEVTKDLIGEINKWTEKNGKNWKKRDLMDLLHSLETHNLVTLD